MERDDGSKEPPAFISVIEWPRIPAVYRKICNLKNRFLTYYAKVQRINDNGDSIDDYILNMIITQMNQKLMMISLMNHGKGN